MLSRGFYESFFGGASLNDVLSRRVDRVHVEVITCFPSRFVAYTDRRESNFAIVFL